MVSLKFTLVMVLLVLPLSDNNVVRLRYVVTNKTVANGASSFTSSNAISTVTDLSILTVDVASGGAERETIQSIKLNAPLDYPSRSCSYN